jgi:predicted alpha/beta hydrolase family esterase
MIQYFTLPGYGNSPAQHWQTHFEQQLSNCRRINQKRWTGVTCEDWTSEIEKTLKDLDTSETILITHSLGGIALAHWAAKHPKQIKGAMIVAPPDIDNPYMDLSLQSFAPIPLLPLPFPSVVVASTNDLWTSMERYKFFAESWGSKLVSIGDAGHINVHSGYGRWDGGLEILKMLV